MKDSVSNLCPSEWLLAMCEIEHEPAFTDDELTAGQRSYDRAHDKRVRELSFGGPYSPPAGAIEP